MILWTGGGVQVTDFFGKTKENKNLMLILIFRILNLCCIFIAPTLLNPHWAH